MKKIHQFLQQKSRAYSGWHETKSHVVVHLAMLVFATAFACNLVYICAQKTFADSIPTTVGFKGTDNPLVYNAQIIQLAKQYQTADETEQQQIIDTLTTVISNRRAILKSEIKNNPKKFAGDILPQGIINQLPESVQSLLEQQIDVEGTLSVIQADGYKNGKEAKFYDVTTTDKKSYHLQFTDKQPNLVTGTKVKVHGISLDQDIALAGGQSPSSTSSTGSLQVTAAATAAATTGAQKTLVILLNFSNSVSEPWTKDQIASTIFNDSNSTNAFYQDNSFGQTSLTGDVVGWYTIPNTNDGCDSNYQSWMSAADQAATNAGVSVSSYPHRVYLINDSTGCSWGGFGQIGGSPTWLISFGYNDPGLFAHEFGHNLGLQHASSLACGANQIDATGNCTFDEYGDRSDVMGNNWYAYNQFNGPHKLALNWLNSTQTKTITTSGTYTLSYTESNDPSTKVLKIARPNTGDFYYVYYRQPLGFDGSLYPSFVNGATIAIWNGISTAQTQLLDMTPGDGDFKNAALIDGSKFTDSINGISIQQMNHSTSSVTLAIQFPTATCTQTQPSISVYPTPQSGAAGLSLTYSVGITNADSAACAASTFTLSNVVPSGWNATLSAPSITVAPNTTGTAIITVTPPATAADGTYSVTVNAQDQFNRAIGGSGSAVLLTDSTPPKVTISAPKNGAAVSSKKPTQIKVTASDSSGIKTITIALDGKTLTTCSSTTSCSSNPKIPAGTHTITATAIDKSSAQLSSSASVTVTSK